MQVQFAANRSSLYALCASIGLTFLFGWWAEAKFLRAIPIRQLVGTAIGASKWSVGFSFLRYLMALNSDKVMDFKETIRIETAENYKA